MLRKLLKEWGRDPRPAAMPLAAAPAGCRLYAIGDIHGRADLLADLHAAILDDHRDRPGDGTDVIVYLGDYVDRGPASRAVIECLANDRLPGFTSVHLMGNHDEAMLHFLDDPTIGPTWASFGGEATLLSYGVRSSPSMIGMRRFEDMRRQLAEKMPADHIAFLRGLQTSYAAGDYFFAHAGVRPGVPVEQQQREDLLWIRDAFLSSDADHGKVIVHGHTPGNAPQVRSNRIGVDTGAFASGVLTCLVLEGTDRRFLATAAVRRPVLRAAV